MDDFQAEQRARALSLKEPEQAVQGDVVTFFLEGHFATRIVAGITGKHLMTEPLMGTLDKKEVLDKPRRVSFDDVYSVHSTPQITG